MSDGIRTRLTNQRCTVPLVLLSMAVCMEGQKADAEFRQLCPTSCAEAHR